MKKLCLYCFIIFFLLSCKEVEKKKFVMMKRIIQNPEQIESIIDASPFKAEYFKKNYFYDTLRKKEYIERLSNDINTYIKPGYNILCERNFEDYHEKMGVRVPYQNFIILGNNNKKKLIVQFIQVLTRWQLNDIYFSSTDGCD